jgi:hypothetical protein
MPKFNFNLRNPKALRPTPVYLVIRYRKYRIVYPTGERILPARWDKKEQRHNYALLNPETKLQELTYNQKKEYYRVKNFNARLTEIYSIAEKIFDTYLKQNDQEEPEPKEYRLLLDVELEKKRFARKDLFTYLNNFIEDRRKIAVKNGKDHQRGASYRSYAQLYKHLTDYIYHVEAEIDFKDIDVDFYYTFADFLRKHKNLLPNTIGKQIKSLKSILNSATINGLNNNMIYKSKFFKVITEKVDNITLDNSELDQFAKLDLSGNTLLDQVRDIFLLSARTGLRYVEFGRIRSVDTQKKTIELTSPDDKFCVSIPLHPDLVHFHAKYNGITPGNLPAALSNVQMNASIKQICSRIPELLEGTEIDLDKKKKGERYTIPNAPKFELVSMQTARRSFFINQYRQGMDVYMLMVISGHKTQDNFLKFIGVTPGEHAANMQMRWQMSDS